MALENPWVGYTIRSYNQIKNSVLTRLGQSNPEVTDHSESNILVIIISIFAGIAEMLGYYIDNMARESFISTCRKYSSAIKLVKLIDYRVKASNPSSVDVLMVFDSATTGAFNIPAGTEVQTGNGISFITEEVIPVPIGSTSISLPVKQITEVNAQNLGTTTGIVDQVINLPLDYADNTAVLDINGDIWVLQKTLGFSTPTDKHFVVEISISKIPYIRFGDGINGAIPPGGQPVLADYYITKGADGNVDPNTINSLVTALVIPGVSSITVSNALSAVAGTDVEDLARIKRSAPLSIRTLDRAVTRQDYKDVTLLTPGVDKAAIYFQCGKFIELFVTPVGGGIAQSTLLNDVFDFVSERKMITTFLEPRPAGETYLDIELLVTARFRMDGVLTETECREKLLEEYSYDKSDINRKIRTSDIIALIDNLGKVDHVELIRLSSIPYARPDGHQVALDAEIHTLSASTAIASWRINYDGTNMRLFKDGIFKQNITIGVQTTTTDNHLSILINVGAYVNGMDWEFKTYPYNKNLEIDDFSVPILRANDLIITVNEQLAVN